MECLDVASVWLSLPQWDSDVRRKNNVIPIGTIICIVVIPTRWKAFKAMRDES